MATKNYHHPFQPYDIQLQFMEAVYECIEGGKVGIFESPTGTGKSLSLICGSLTWLREHKRRTFDEAMAAVEVDDGEPEWMAEHARATRRKEARQMRDEFEARLEAVREKDQQVRQRAANGEPLLKRQKHSQDVSAESIDAEEYFLLDDCEVSSHNGASTNGLQEEYSAATKQLMETLGFLGKKDRGETTAEIPEELKVYFCSRTHSQLSQFVGELTRVRLPPGLPPVEEDASKNVAKAPVEALKHISLGSRKNLCINPNVNKLSSQTAINERCLELQQPKTAAEHKCPFLPKKGDEDMLLDFRDHALSKVQDIEDLANVGRELGVCPYYASRPAVSPAEIVTLPYPLLLQKTAREALGISLRGHIVIIDEAHNLMDAIEGIYSTHISGSQLSFAKQSLMLYLQKFRNRLKGANRVYVTQVVRVLDSLMSFATALKERSGIGGTVEPSELLSGKAVDQINLSKLVQYLVDSKLARKVEGYVAHATKQQDGDDRGTQNDKSRTLDVPTLTNVQNFLISLMNPAKEGRFFWSKEADTPVIRYMLLDPSEHFRDVIESARAVILAGGTMSPMDDYKQQLSPYLPSISTLSCGHIIPANNLMVRCATADRHGNLEFGYKMRSLSSTMDRLGEALLASIQLINGGTVVFFASYKYLEEVLQRWQATSTLRKLNGCKTVFCDSRSGSAEEVFAKYSDTIKVDPRKGALLLSVIGGKLSEGINFSDDLGRCVLVVGLPYPNLETPEWKAKLEYIDDKAVARGETRGKASREHAENVCMRAVNQAIGRVIRHKNDWAGIVLLGAPYGRKNIRAKLPGWIQRGMGGLNGGGIADQSEDVSSLLRGLTTFFANKRHRE